MQQHREANLKIWGKAVQEGPITVTLRRKYFYSISFTFSFIFNQHAIDQGILLY